MSTDNRCFQASLVGEPKRIEVVHGWKRIWFSILAFLCFSIGLLGIPIPGLPATPFLLLCSYFLVRTSPKLNDAMVSSRLVGPILSDWQQRGGLRRRIKYQAIAWVIIAVGCAIYFANASMPFCVAIAMAALIGIGVILRLPTVSSDR